MELNTDQTFHIGQQHLKVGKPCQDYALSGRYRKSAFAIVSDGCSSGGKTDIGARLVSLATQRAIYELIGDKDESITAKKAQKINHRVATYLNQFAVALGVDIRDTLATCLWAVVAGGKVYCNVSGDGVVMVNYQNSWLAHRFTWTNNTPYYPAYYPTQSSFTQCHLETQKPFECEYSGGHGDGVDVVFTEGYTAEAGIPGFGLEFDLAGQDSSGPLQSITLFSDGVEQVDQVSYFDAIEQLTLFKSTKGQFAVRRMNRFLQEAHKLGRGPIDDIAMAVIDIDQDEEEKQGDSNDSDQESHEN